MVIAQPAEPATLLPPLAWMSIERQITDLLYDRLAEIGDGLNTVGDRGFKKQLAERWEWGPDSLSIAFHLDPRARWHDGVPVRASDVRYSFALMKDAALGAPGLPLITNIDSVAVRDSLTAVAYFKRHTPEQFYDLVYQVLIVPEHLLSNTPPGQMKTAPNSFMCRCPENVRSGTARSPRTSRLTTRMRSTAPVRRPAR